MQYDNKVYDPRIADLLIGTPVLADKCRNEEVGDTWVSHHFNPSMHEFSHATAAEHEGLTSFFFILRMNKNIPESIPWTKRECKNCFPTMYIGLEKLHEGHFYLHIIYLTETNQSK